MAATVEDMLQTLGLSDRAAAYAVDDDGLGLDTLEAWRDLQVDDDLDALAKNFRSPGGFVRQGNRDIPNPGYAVSVQAMGNLKILRLGLKHFTNIQRTISTDDIDLDWIEVWEFLVEFKKEAMKNKPKSDTELPKINMKDWARTKEKIFKYFHSSFGTTGLPLAYVIREEEEVKAEAEDPQEDYNEDFIKELIQRAPMEGRTYITDNRTMADCILRMCEDTPAYEHINKKSMQTDGRSMWNTLVEVYLGPQHVKLQQVIYEKKIRSYTYHGETRNFGLEKYINIHLESHARLASVDKALDEGTKIIYFVEGIKDPKMEATLESIESTPDEHSTFDSVVRQLRDKLAKIGSTDKGGPNRYRHVASVLTTKDGSEMFAGVEADMSAEDKYYPSKEWRRLSNAQKKGVLLKRRNRDGGGPPSKKRRVAAVNTKKLQKKIKQLERSISALQVDDRSMDDESKDDTGDDEAPSGRNHPKLNRKSKGKNKD